MHKELPQAYRDRLAYPVIPTFVVAGTKERVGGMLAAWWTQLSFNPFLMGVAVAPERYTYRLLIEAGKFSLNVVDFKYVDVMPYIGDVSERFLKGKIWKAGFTVEWDGESGIPYIREARGYMLLKLIDRRKYGDHDLFVGEVLKAYADETFVDGRWDLSKYKPLMYMGRTRRPAKVKRIYVTFKEAEVREIEFAGGLLKKYSGMRYGVLNELRELLKKVGSLESEAFRSGALEILGKYGLDEEDLKYYIDELSRSL